MSPLKQGVTWRFYAIVAFALLVAIGAHLFNRAREPELVKQAILNVAPAGAKVTAYEISTSGRRSSLWCGSVAGMENGTVAVLLRETPLVSVSRVAPAWEPDPNWRHRWMLSECREAAASRAAALP